MNNIRVLASLMWSKVHEDAISAIFEVFYLKVGIALLFGLVGFFAAIGAALSAPFALALSLTIPLFSNLAFIDVLAWTWSILTTFVGAGIAGHIFKRRR